MTGSPRRFRPGEILRVLEREGVRFVLIGGLAAAAHGSPHLTVDLDICPERSPANLARLAAALRNLRARLRVPDRRAGRPFPVEPAFLALADTRNLVTRAGDLNLCFLPAGTRGFGDLARDAAPVTIRGVRVSTASLADVIRSKEAANRPKDQAVLATLRELLARTAPRRRRPRGKR